MPLEIRSPAFEPGGVIPHKYARDGEDISPPLVWKNVLEATKSFAIMLDAQEDGTVRTHWIIYEVYKDIRELPEKIPHQDTLSQWTHEGVSVRQGKNDFDRVGYTGPLPSTRPPHVNAFTLYALDCFLHVPPGCRKAGLLGAMSGHVLEQAELIGIYTP